MPYARTRYAGPSFDPSSAAISTYGATLRAFEPGGRLGFGVGYGGIVGATFGTEPPSTIASEAAGVRLELVDRILASPRTTLELTLAGEPDLHGTTRTSTGISGAPTRFDAARGTQLDASAVAVVRANRALAFAYGVRYDATTLHFAASDKIVERETQVLPFVQVRVRL